MIKYTYGLVACLMISSTIFGGEPRQNPKPLELKKKNELKNQESELIVATSLLKKNKGKNGVAVDASWEQLEVMQDTLDFIVDQLENRSENQ